MGNCLNILWGEVLIGTRSARRKGFYADKHFLIETPT